MLTHFKTMSPKTNSTNKDSMISQINCAVAAISDAKELSYLPHF